MVAEVEFFADLVFGEPPADIGEVGRDERAEGRPAKGMPATGFSDAEATAMLDFLGWLSEHREALRQQLGIDAESRGLPWFEFQ